MLTMNVIQTLYVMSAWQNVVQGVINIIAHGLGVLIANTPSGR